MCLLFGLFLNSLYEVGVDRTHAMNGAVPTHANKGI